MSTKTLKAKTVKRSGSPADFYWKRLDGGYLVTNDFGAHAWLSPAAFKSFSSGKGGSGLPQELIDGGFVRDQMDLDGLAGKWRNMNAFLYSGPSLHILVMTLRCNHGCLYCQSGSAAGSGKNTDMSWATAKKSIDFAFQTTASKLTIEFQGGEPLLNWGTLKKTIAYAREKAGKSNKRVSMALVSNFSLMTEEKARFLLENEVSLCTSLDGPEDLHNDNRICRGLNSHAAVSKWLKYFSQRHSKQGEPYRIFDVAALLTVTRASLGRHREIVEEYRGKGLRDIFLRPLSRIGYAGKNWDKVGYTAAEFTAFYAAGLDYILALNRKGVFLREKLASMLLDKVIAGRDSGYLDLRCPCGAAIGQIAYNHDGSMYTCDEGRMVAEQGDELFRIGDVRKDSYAKVVAGTTARACVMASELHLQPECSRCAYSPYCGVCPVASYEGQRSLWGNMPSNERCALMKGVFGVLFSRLKRPADKEIFVSWLTK